ncbi:MAG TPA: ABC transporter permease [Propionicimonas sp.]
MSTDSATTESVAKSVVKGSSWRERVQQLMALAGLVLIFIVFTVASPQIFPSYSNVTAILFSTTVVGLLALGSTLVIITGGIDLSVGTAMTLSAVMSATFIANWHMPVWLGIIMTIVFGGLVGLINGFNVAILGLPPFIATLAMMLVAQGLALVISNARPIYFDPTAHAGYIWLSTGSIIPGARFPNAVIVLALAAVVAFILLNKTLLGRYDISIGSNEEATALSGINTKKWLIIIYAVAGLFVGLAAIMISARLGSAQPATGAGYELQAIAAVVIGGTSLSGGKGTIVGTIIGALIISVINNGLQIISVRQEWQNVILGLVILIVVFIDQLRARRAATT